MTVAENVAVRRRLSAPARPDRWGRAARRTRRGCLERDGRRRRSRRPGRRACRRPSARSSRSPAPWPSSATCWCWTSRPRRCRKPTSRACWRSCAGCEAAASASSTSRIGWTRCSASPIGSPCCATAGTSCPSAVADTTPDSSGPQHRRPLAGGGLHAAAAVAAGDRPGRHRTWSRTGPGRSPSLCAPARSWAWSVCAVPGTTSSAAPSSASSRSVPACRGGRRRAAGRIRRRTPWRAGSASSPAGAARRAWRPT